MKKNTYHLLLLVITLWAMTSCKKTEQNFNVGPKLVIIFDDLIDKVTADYKVGSTFTLKVGAQGANSINVVSSYPTGTVRTVNLGSFPVTNGVATISIPASMLRATADGNPVGAGTAPTPLPAGVAATAYTRANNTYTLTIDAVAGGVTERRIYNAVLVQ